MKDTAKKRIMPSGLVNVGNSCYLSSVLQLLASAGTVLIDHFSNCGIIGQELAKVLKEINEGKGIVKPKEFIKSFTGSAGFSSDQQDAHEFLLALLNLKPAESMRLAGLLEVTRTAVCNSGIFRIRTPFTGVLMNELICLPCAVKRKPRHISSLRIEPFSCVTLTPTDGSSSINEAVYKHFCVPERFSDYSNYSNDGSKCGLGAINQKNPLLLPELLFLHVSLLSESFMKSDRRIGTEFELSGPGYRYKLLALVVHLGSNGLGGHFICYRRHGKSNWIECNDTRVKITSEAEVLKQRAYLFLYQKE